MLQGPRRFCRPEVTAGEGTGARAGAGGESGAGAGAGVLRWVTSCRCLMRPGHTTPGYSTSLNRPHDVFRVTLLTNPAQNGGDHISSELFDIFVRKGSQN